MSGMYCIENNVTEHASMLKYTVVGWGEKQPDMYLVSKEGVKVYTQRILLSFYSKMLGEVLDDIKEDLAGVSVPASSSSLTMMLKVLVSGSVIATNKADLLEVGQAAEALGIVLNDRQIGYRKKTTANVPKKIMIKEAVAISGEKVSFSKETIESNLEIKSEPMEADNGDDENVDKSKLNGGVGTRPNKKKKKHNVREDLNESKTSDDKTCGQCGKSFASAARLNLHMNVHKEDKPYKCDQCDKGFSAPASLKNHKLLHTGETFKCEFCEYSAVQKGNLKSHRLKNHKDMLEENVSEEKVTGVEAENTEASFNENAEASVTENTEAALIENPHDLSEGGN